jgi:murein L,D-transpeptidase YafK
VLPRLHYIIPVIALLAACSEQRQTPPAGHVERAAFFAQLRLEDALESTDLEFGDPIFIRIFKQEHELEVWLQHDERFALLRTYPICSYSGTLGPKLAEGDRQAPEGFYFVTRGRMNPQSNYHLAFDVGYPNAYDRAHGRTGSAIMVHGICASLGCYAMTNPLIEEIYSLADTALKRGQDFFRVHIFPFRMTDESMERHQNSRWIEFWRNLKTGYDHFERNRTPPDVTVENNRYVFSLS